MEEGQEIGAGVLFAASPGSAMSYEDIMKTDEAHLQAAQVLKQDQKIYYNTNKLPK